MGKNENNEKKTGKNGPSPLGKMKSLSQAVANVRGLFSEEKINIYFSGFTDKNNVDGVHIFFSNNKLFVKYSSFFKNEQFKNGKALEEIENIVDTILSNIEKEYSKISNKSISLTRSKENTKVNIDAISAKNVHINFSVVVNVSWGSGEDE